MKNTFKLIIAIVAIIEVSVMACSDPGSGGDTTGGNNGGTTNPGSSGSTQLSGNYYLDSEWFSIFLTFSGSNWSMTLEGDNGMGGTYTITGNSVAMTITRISPDFAAFFGVSVGYVDHMTIVNDTTLRDDEGDWHKR